MRFERKYRVEIMSLAEVRQILWMHPASFMEHHPDRQINNIYFDSADLVSMGLNHSGVGYRKKYRVRWYDADPQNVSRPTFEIKLKKNELGGKESQVLDPFDLNDLTSLTENVNQLVPGSIRLQPVLLNSYSRSYLISADGKFRITIDHHMRYHSLLNRPFFTGYIHHDPAIVIELKYEAATDDLLSEISQYLPFRQTKHSKYVTGVEMTN
jgi:SPX domain protein involved in polyphosphate accumulation